MEKICAVDKRKEVLTVLEVLKYFKDFSGKLKPSLPPLNPKSGEIFLYLIDDKVHHKDDWRVDGYRWYQNGTKLIPADDPKVCKIHFSIVLPSGRDLRFKRHAYFTLDAQQKRGNTVLLHYVGNESIIVDYPHGNAKHNHNYYRTCPSVLSDLSSIHDLPSNVYKNSVASSNCLTEYQSHLVPRNSRQIINLQKKERQKLRLSHDALYNLHELAYDLKDFVKVVKTFPNLVVVCGLDILLKELDLILQGQSQLHFPQLLSYDTTFQLGDFYLSPLLFRHTLFCTSPVIPVLFLIHERKFQEVHEEAMEILAKFVPRLVTGKQKVPLVTDDEPGIYKAIGKHLPNVLLLRCWNHTINAIKVWLKKHGAIHAEIPVYVNQVRDLLNASNYTNYVEKLGEFKAKWSRAFVEYFMTEIHPEVPKTLGRFVLESMNLYHPFTGLTNNQSESFNATMKRLQRWREVPVDSILLSLYHLQAYFHNEIQRGFAGLGNYRLSSQFSAAAKSKEELHIITCYSPQELVDKIQKKGDVREISSTEFSVDGGPVDGKVDDGSDNPPLITQSLRARSIIEKQQISHNQALGVFTVLGTTGNPHAIRLFPKESCTCPCTSRCYHIMAVRMSIGLHDDDGDAKRKINLTQLRRNTRSRSDKKSGRKAPRTGDYDVLPAPDSAASASFQNDLPQGNAPDALDDVPDADVPSPVINDPTEKSDHPSQSSQGGKKRRRCGTCECCTTTDCGQCRYCQDKPRFGGKGVLRQCCIRRKCKKLKPDSNQSTLSTRQDLKGKKDVVVVTINSCTVYDSNLSTLNDTNWLDDKIINAYVYLIMEEVNSVTPNSVFCTSCFFYQQLSLRGYKAIANWIKVNILSYKKFIIPINRGAHWCLVVIDIQKKELRFYDSMGGDYYTCLERIRAYLREANPMTNFSSWKMMCPKDIPMQSNGYDCGVFTCMFARYQSLDLPFIFSQEHIPEIRKKMILELKGKTLIM